MYIAITPNAYWMTAPLVAFLISTPLNNASVVEPQKLRAAAIAGSFYPSDPAALSAMIDDLLAHVSGPSVTGQILAAVVPHAGYVYSGSVAAHAYAALKGRKLTRVVLIAPSHHESFAYSSIYDGDAYATPLGNVPVDKAFARQLARMSPAMQLSGHGHDPAPSGGEHAIEVELPWLQKVLGSFELVPIVMGDQSYESSRALGVALAQLIDSQGKQDETLVLASSDLSHFHSYDDAVKIDRKSLGAIEAWDYFSASRNFQSRVWEACGGAPIVAAMIYAERMGANHARLLKYENSGDVTGDHSSVVGYSAVAFVKTPAESAEQIPFSLSDQEKSELLTLARNSVESAVQQNKLYEPPASVSPTLNQERGAFVTLTKSGDLRGCIGYTSAVKPLYITVRDTATHAALHDPRFQAVSPSELPHLEYEISVLSPLRRVTDIQQIRIGEHGLLIKNGNSEGLLLPQVPVEQKWDRQTFIEQTCRKARLDPNCWMDEDTDIFAFSAVVFHEQKP